MDFLLELLSEEIPARMQLRAKADLASAFGDALTKAGLSADSIEAFATPRRLALIVQGLPAASTAESAEFKGPRVGAPDAAIDGFLRKTGLGRDALIERDGVYFAQVTREGRATAAILAEIIPAIIRGFGWPKSMRWGSASQSSDALRWVRPLQAIVALLDGEIVPLSFDGLVSGRETMGHRFMGGGAPVTIASAATYVEDLRAAHVIVHQSERCQIIRDGAAAAAASAGLTLVEDEGLVIENAGLTEWPVPLLGRFDPSYLEVPPEVIQLTARVNQKYFVCADGAGKLAPIFVCTANISATDGGTAIVAGNEKVLAARLSDAKFFWEQDLAVPLDAQAQKLAQITFHEKLGSIADKVERVAKLARWLVESGVVQPNTVRVERSRDTQASDNRLSTTLEANGDVAQLADQAERAARLAKADLVTGMVGEFPELQGLMGAYYARAQGEVDAVADAIRDHYKPVGQGDDVPTAPVTVAVSLADKLDTLFGFFMVSEKPTGSKDPFALRRAGIGVLALLQANDLRISINIGLVAYWAQAMIPILAAGSMEKVLEDVETLKRLNIERGLDELARDVTSTRESILSTDQLEAMIASGLEVFPFLVDRLKVQQREAGVRHDLIDAVFALGGEDDLVRLLARVQALQAFVATPDGANLLAGHKRAANILKQAGEGADKETSHAEPVSASMAGSWTLEQVQGDARLGASDGELYRALNTAEPNATAAIAAEDFAGAMTALASLRAPIDQFFTDVMVNDPDPEVRRFRLGLLRRFRDACHGVADFSQIEG